MFLMTFATTYMCEVGFSMLVALKTKYRNALSVESDLHLKLTSIQPDIKSLTAEKQHHSLGTVWKTADQIVGLFFTKTDKV